MLTRSGTKQPLKLLNSVGTMMKNTTRMLRQATRMPYRRLPGAYLVEVLVISCVFLRYTNRMLGRRSLTCTQMANVIETRFMRFVANRQRILTLPRPADTN